MTESTITFEQVEDLAHQLESAEDLRRGKLQSLIAAEARILAVREPQTFAARALEYGDEDGSWDNSYAPDMRYKNRTGPRLIKVHAADWDQVATSGGFYHDWRAVVSDLGLYVDRKGVIYGCEYSGTGHFGQFAAAPGSSGVELTLDWSPRDLDDVSTCDLVMVEETLRDLAFPRVAEREAAAQPSV